MVLRFSRYAEHPARAALMSHKCNPATYYQEVLRFLHVDAMALDSGHCEPLRRDAWAAARGSNALQTEAILHLLSQPVQEELATFAMAIETSTLDVERKHNLDGHSEARHVASVAKASRDGFVRHWRMQSRAAVPTTKERKQQRADTHANKVSLSLVTRPDLFPQARGKLHSGKKCRKKLTLRPAAPAALAGICGGAQG